MLVARTRSASAVVVAPAALVGAAGALLAVVLAGPRGSGPVLDQASFALVTLVYLAVAVVIVVAKPGHLVGLFALVGTVATGLSSGLVALGERGLVDRPGSVPGANGLVAAGLAGRAMGWVVLVAVLPLVFPDGVVAGSPRRRRFAQVTATGAVVLLGLAALIAPEMVDNRLAGRHSLWGFPGWVGSLAGFMSVLAMLLTAAATALALAGFRTRWRRGDPLERQQLLWFALAFIPPVALVPVFIALPVTAWAFALTLLPVPLALAVAMFQHHLYDVQLAVSRTVTWLGLSAAVAALYAITVGGVGAMLRDRGDTWVPWIGAGVVAVSFAPLRNALQASVDRMVYGHWSQAAEALAATGRRLTAAADVPALLRELTDDLVDGLGLAHVEIRDVDGRTLSRSGVAGPATELTPLTAYGRVVGSLVWSGRRLRDADRTRLDDLARHIGGVVHSFQLVDELRAAQERLVLASEDERRRLRRDLHDGLGPALAGLALQVDTVRNLLAADEAVVGAVDAQLLRLRSGIQSTVVDVRRIVEGLRPPALDQLGLVGAVAELAERLGREAGCCIDVSAPPALPRLPAAVEVAAFRVTQEALTNVVRHSRATTCQVGVSSSPRELQISVQDNGTGLVSPRHGGVGLGSMHERAVELGGRLDLVAVPGAGTTVALHLPLDSSLDPEPATR